MWSFRPASQEATNLQEVSGLLQTRTTSKPQWLCIGRMGISWDTMRNLWEMMRKYEKLWEYGIYMDIKKYLGIWECDGNMMGIWWEYDGNMMGIWWEYRNNTLSISYGIYKPWYGICWEYNRYGNMMGYYLSWTNSIGYHLSNLLLKTCSVSHNLMVHHQISSFAICIGLSPTWGQIQIGVVGKASSLVRPIISWLWDVGSPFDPRVSHHFPIDGH